MMQTFVVEMSYCSFLLHDCSVNQVLNYLAYSANNTLALVEIIFSQTVGEII